MKLPRSIVPALALVMASCAAHAPPGTADPATAAAVIAATAPDRPLHVVFQWQALEGDARFSGQGVARIQPPGHARLDLFGPRGDTYLSAALVDDELRLPPGVQGVEIPPPALMWAVLGTVAPPDGALLVGTREQGDRTELYFEVDGGSVWYILERTRLRSVRWEAPGRRMTVELRGESAHRLPSQAVYRDFSAVTELMLNVETAHESEPFPPDIWAPGR
jgi:hypothetical protein